MTITIINEWVVIGYFAIGVLSYLPLYWRAWRKYLANHWGGKEPKRFWAWMRWRHEDDLFRIVVGIVLWPAVLWEERNR